MTQYNNANDPSMWLKYKGHVCVEWTRYEYWNTQFPWLTGTDIQTYEDNPGDLLFPFRTIDGLMGGTLHSTEQSSSMKLFINTDRISFGYKKSDLDMEMSSTQGSLTDDGGGPKLKSSAAYDVNNTVTVTGYLESDVWRDEQPFTPSPGDPTVGAGLWQPGYSLMQKQLLLQEFAKRSGVQDAKDGSHWTNPLLLRLNYGYNRSNFNNFKKYLIDDVSLSYKAMMSEMKHKWMPQYYAAWEYSSGSPYTVTQIMQIKGEMTTGTPTWDGQIPAALAEMIFSNCVLDDCRLKLDAANPMRIGVELKFIVDTNSQRWSMDGSRWDDVTRLVANGWRDSWNYLKPVGILETAPAAFSGECEDIW